MKICLMGASTDTGNRGVSALAVSLVKNILINQPSAEISFITGSRDGKPQHITLADKEFEIPTVAYRLSPRAKPGQQLLVIFFLALVYRMAVLPSLQRKICRLSRVLQSIIDADWVGDIWGGDSFSDIYGFRRFFIGTIPDLIVLLLGKKLVFLPQTYGPFSDGKTRVLVTMLLKRAHRMYSRDEQSIKLVHDLIGNATAKPVMLFCPDVAFMLDPVKPAHIRITPPVDQGDGIIIGFNVNGLMYNGGYTRGNMFGLSVDYGRLVLELVDSLCGRENTRVILIPHTYGPPGGINSDPDACIKVIGELPGRPIHYLQGEYNQSELKYVIGGCDFFIGSRMHSCIAALSQAVPTAGLAYSKKFIGVFTSVGAQDMVIDCRTAREEQIQQSVNDLFERRDDLKPILKRTVQRAQEKIRQSFAELVRS